MTDTVSDILTSFIVAIVITLPIMVVLVLSGNLEYIVKELTLPAYQIAFVLWLIMTITVFWFLRSDEPKMYES